MRFCKLGQSELKISTIVMGTFQAGKDKWANIDDTDSTGAIRAAFDSGITTFDSAEAYGKGHAERILGAALAGVRDQVVLATKVSPNRLGFDQVLNACHNSLKNLQTDYIDLYQVHWPSGSFGGEVVPIEETMAAMNKLKDQGKIRAIGVSNFSQAQVEEAAQYAVIDSLQPPYSLFWRQVEENTKAYCIAAGISILAYSPMAQGLLTGKFGPDHKFQKGDHRSKNKLYQPQIYQRVQQALDRLRPIAGQLGVALGQLALAWITSHPGVCAIAGARNAQQAAMNARAADLSLPPEILVQLDQIGRSVTDNLGQNPVMWRT
ncbi:aldo/keto reductase [Alkalispirochaeta odontotermitis]|nr:aldo/keto reductase [Alkalispirochaeta odontotermitis]CAB1081036.1 Aldo/keto reductase [Olavius algarvensis Delta 1 endosymbiont]